MNAIPQPALFVGFPGQAAFYFDLRGEAEKGPDDNNAGEHATPCSVGSIATVPVSNSPAALWLIEIASV